MVVGHASERFRRGCQPPLPHPQTTLELHRHAHTGAATPLLLMLMTWQPWRRYGAGGVLAVAGGAVDPTPRSVARVVWKVLRLFFVVCCGELRATATGSVVHTGVIIIIAGDGGAAVIVAVSTPSSSCVVMRPCCVPRVSFITTDAAVAVLATTESVDKRTMGRVLTGAHVPAFTTLAV